MLSPTKSEIHAQAGYVSESLETSDLTLKKPDGIPPGGTPDLGRCVYVQYIQNIQNIYIIVYIYYIVYII